MADDKPKKPRDQDDVELLKRLAAAGADLALLEAAAATGNPPAGMVPQTKEGQKALEAVLLLGKVAQQQRELAEKEKRRADDEYRRAEEAMLQRQAAWKERDEAGRTWMPEEGWSSPRAAQLVEAVRPIDRPLLFGDLLAQLAPHAGETGANETAADILRRKLAEAPKLSEASQRLGEAIFRTGRENEELRGQRDALQNALAARRAPDAEAGEQLAEVAAVLDGVGWLDENEEITLGGICRALVDELHGLRSFFSTNPLMAVGVRDDSTPALKERYTLLQLRWDGKKLDVKSGEARRPWGELVLEMRRMVDATLIPKDHR